MSFLGEALRAVNRNPVPLVMIMVAYVVIGAVNIGVIEYTGLGDDDTDPTPASQALLFGSELLAAFIYALVQAVAFARIGAEIDRPLWKIESDGEALRRFFALWLILNLIVFLLQRLSTQAATVYESPALAGPLFMVALLALILAVPAGAAIMFFGRPGKEETSQAFRTLFNQFPRTLGVLLLNFLIIVVVVSLSQPDTAPVWARPIFGVVGAYGDCYIFAATWIVCMYDREESEEDNSDIF